MPKTAPSLSYPSQTIRAARIEKGMTLRQLATRIAMPYSTLSKLENGKMAMTYDKLVRLAQGLGVDLGSLVSAPKVDSQPSPALGRRSVSRAGEWPNVTSEHHRHLYPAADLLGKSMVPILIDVIETDLSAKGGLVRHGGEEYLYILDGAMELHSDLYAPLPLAAGDSVYFDSGMAHAYVRTSKGPCRVLSICSGSGIRRFSEAEGMLKPEARPPAEA